MSNCHSCGAAIAEADRFCGICGSPRIRASVSQSPARTSEVAAPRQISPRIPWVVAGMLTVCLLAAALFYFAPWEATQPIHQAGKAQKDGTDQSESPGTGDSGQPALTQEVGLPASDELAMPSSPALETVVEPGRWRFTHVLVNVTRANPSDTRDFLEGDDIGAKGSSERCITEAVVRAPEQAEFPPLPAPGCRTTDFALSGGHFRAHYLCRFNRDPNGIRATVEGPYTRKDLQVLALLNRPADLGSDDMSYRPPQIVLHYRIVGKYLGPCR